MMYVLKVFFVLFKGDWPKVMSQFSCSVQTWNVRQAETDLFQMVTMPTFVLNGVNMMYTWHTFHVWSLNATF